MRFVAENKEDYAQLLMLQKVITQFYKNEKGTSSQLEAIYKKAINVSIEKTYEMPGASATVANSASIMETDDPDLIKPYIVHSALQRKKAAIEYADAKGNVSKRLIEPHAWRGDNQVVAWCHERGAWRQFKLDKIVRIAIINEDFLRQDEVNITSSDGTK